MNSLLPKLLKGEYIVYTTGYHWVYVFKACLPLFGVFTAGWLSWSLFRSELLSAIFMLLFVLSIVWLLIKIFDTMIIRAFVTNQRLIYRRGWTHRNTVDVTLDRIGGVDMDQDVWQRFFGYGTIKVLVPVVEIILPRFLRNPLEFRRALYIQKKIEEKPDDDPQDLLPKEEKEADGRELVTLKSAFGGGGAMAAKFKTDKQAPSKDDRDDRDEQEIALEALDNAQADGADATGDSES